MTFLRQFYREKDSLKGASFSPSSFQLGSGYQCGFESHSPPTVLAPSARGCVQILRKRLFYRKWEMAELLLDGTDLHILSDAYDHHQRTVKCVVKLRSATSITACQRPGAGKIVVHSQEEYCRKGGKKGGKRGGSVSDSEGDLNWDSSSTSVANSDSHHNAKSSSIFKFLHGNRRSSHELVIRALNPQEHETWVDCLRHAVDYATWLNDFSSVGAIGSGSGGDVSLVRHRPMDRYLAVKSLSIRTSRRRRRAHEEARIMKEIKDLQRLQGASEQGGAHCLVSMRSIVEYSQFMFIMMEFCRGGDLLSFVRRVGRLPESAVFSILRQVIVAIRELHRLRILHLDVKPQNIFKVEDDEENFQVKLGDFGLSTRIADPSKTYRWKNYVRGTPGFIAPEILNFSQYSTGADIFSCGALLYFLLAGRGPFQEDTVEATLKNNAKLSFDNCESRMWDSVSPTAKNLVVWMMQPLSSERPSCEEVLDYLEYL